MQRFACITCMSELRYSLALPWLLLLFHLSLHSIKQAHTPFVSYVAMSLQCIITGSLAVAAGRTKGRCMVSCDFSRYLTLRRCVNALSWLTDDRPNYINMWLYIVTCWWIMANVSCSTCWGWSRQTVCLRKQNDDATSWRRIIIIIIINAKIKVTLNRNAAGWIRRLNMEDIFSWADYENVVGSPSMRGLPTGAVSVGYIHTGQGRSQKFFGGGIKVFGEV